MQYILFAGASGAFLAGNMLRKTIRKSHVLRVVLTGGPCGGKSSGMKKIKTVLQEQNYDVYTCPEVPTILIDSGFKYPGLAEEKRPELLEFEVQLMKLQLQLEDTYVKIASSRNKKACVIYDRGCVDIAAYVPGEIFNQVMSKVATNKSELFLRYDMVLHLQSAAIGAEEFYTCANNSARTESIDEAKELDLKIFKSWEGHPHQYVIANEKSKSFNDKIQEVCSTVLRHISL